MRLHKLLIFIIVFMFSLGFVSEAMAQWTVTPYTSSRIVMLPSAPEVRINFWNMDSLQYPFVSPTVGAGRVLQDTTWLTYFSSLIAGDTCRFTFFGKYSYDSAGAERSKWDSCGTQLVVGNTDSNQIKQTKMFWHKFYTDVRVVVRRVSAATVPILASLSNRVLWITLTTKRNVYIPERPAYDSPYK